MKKSPPVIIIGVGRSGKGILTKLLADLGLFIGKKVNPISYEAYFFQSVNKFLLAACGGGVNNPSPIKYLLEDKQMRAIVADFVCFVLRTPKVASFLGFKGYFKYRTPENLDIPWGWKDPRTTFTLPIWLQIFSNAKVIHVYRHGVDVANCLKERYDRIVSTIQHRSANYGVLYKFLWLRRYLPRRNELADIRAATLDGGFSLWEEYIAEAKRHVNSLKDRAIEVQFEHLMEEPVGVLRKTAEFCELQVTQASIQNVTRAIKKDRAYSYRSNEELQNFANEVSARLNHYGY